MAQTDLDAQSVAILGANVETRRPYTIEFLPWGKPSGSDVGTLNKAPALRWKLILQMDCHNPMLISMTLLYTTRSNVTVNIYSIIPIIHTGCIGGDRGAFIVCLTVTSYK